MPKRIAVLVALLAVCVLPTLAYSESIAFGTAEVFWDSLRVITDPTITMVFDSYASRTVLLLNGVEIVDQQKNNWTEVHVASDEIEGLNYSAYGLASNTNVSPQLLSVALVSSSNLAGQFSADATAQRWALWHAVGSGNVTVEVDYRLASTLVSDSGDEAFGHSLANIQIDNLAGFRANNTQDRHIPILRSNVQNGDSYSDLSEGRMSASLYFNDGDTGGFQAWAQSSYFVNSPIHVPETSSSILLGAGFAVCALFATRRQVMTRRRGQTRQRTRSRWSSSRA